MEKNIETIDVVYSDLVKTENDLREVFANNKGLYVVENDLILCRCLQLEIIVLFVALPKTKV